MSKQAVTESELFALRAAYALLVKGFEKGYFDMSNDQFQLDFDCICEELGEPTVPIEH